MGESIKIVCVVPKIKRLIINLEFESVASIQVTRNGVALDAVVLKFFEAAIEDDVDKLSQSFDVYDVCRGDGGSKKFPRKLDF